MMPHLHPSPIRPCSGSGDSITAPRRVGFAIMTVLALVLAMTACADFQSPEDPTGGLPDQLLPTPSFALDIEPMLDRRCATGGCHSPRTRQVELVLAIGESYDAIVDVESRLLPGALLVEPSNADASWIVRMISSDPAGRGGLSRMPLASTPLTPNQIDNIRTWINQGAQRN
ncbi:MAG TPA: hypothetical protein VMM18_13675 [Gemmatimonadaceae bacterium]|nr:hypothetical protein [Gemmatimonadaceae bacterium]